MEILDNIVIVFSVILMIYIMIISSLFFLWTTVGLYRDYLEFKKEKKSNPKGYS